MPRRARRQPSADSPAIARQPKHGKRGKRHQAESPAAAAERDYATARLPVAQVDAATRVLPASPAGQPGAGAPERAVARRAPTELVVPAAPDDLVPRPVVIPGRGRPMGRVGAPRRRAGHAHRSRLARALVTGITIGVVASALLSVSPLAAGAQDAGPAAFHAVASIFGGAKAPSYVWYVAQPGDTVETIATRHDCQVGGIYELNDMLAGEEVQVGKAYKLPTSATYGLYFRPASSVAVAGGYGTTVLGDHIWNSYAGTPPDGALCGPPPRFYGGNGTDMRNYNLASFDLKSPNWGAYWVRGFTWYHFGVDLANPMGTPVHAAQAGEVIFANWDTGGGGWSVKINHCDHLSTAYGHMETLLVHDGQMVHAGDVIGLEGSTGNSTGPHVHFSVQWDNLAVDPMLFFGGSKYNITHYLPDA
jgi:murein DD-endopeptidase MepM/ murein hydrolase activator NlpD